MRTLIFILFAAILAVAGLLYYMQEPVSEPAETTTQAAEESTPVQAEETSAPDSALQPQRGTLPWRYLIPLPIIALILGVYWNWQRTKQEWNSDVKPRKGKSRKSKV